MHSAEVMLHDVIEESCAAICEECKLGHAVVQFQNDNNLYHEPNAALCRATRLRRKFGQPAIIPTVGVGYKKEEGVA